MNKLLNTLVELGKWFTDTAVNDQELLKAAEAHNGWFTKDSVISSFKSLSAMLEEDSLKAWFAQYNLGDQDESEGKTLGLIMAGNIPLVGFHDIISGLVTGCKVVVKASRDDAILPRAVVKKLEELNPSLKGRIQFVEGKLGEVDAVIATGSGNTTRYFDAYFGHMPHIFRSQRTGVAVLDGSESESDLEGLGNDMFTHYGLGCRSTTKVFLPEGFDLDRCFAQWVKWSDLSNHNKYANNYDYHKAIWLLNSEDLLENGFLLVKKDEGWVSPVGTLFIEYYSDAEDLANKIASYSDGLQLVTSRPNSPFRTLLSEKNSSIPQGNLGSAQCPSLTDYADSVDTIAFLQNL